MRTRLLAGLLLCPLLLTGCATGTPGGSPSGNPPTTSASPDKLLVIFVRVEPSTLATRSFVQKSAGLFVPWRLFNALPALVDAHGDSLPELLAELPALNTGSWQVFPDGTMQTNYTVRPNLTWHDGQPLTADDFVFGWRVYSHPDLGLASQPPMSAIADASVTDKEHFTIRWKALYPDADSLSAIDRELSPLPQHVFGASLDQMASSGKDQFINHPGWSTQYVGSGPYRLQNREPGSFLDLVRFDGYALGVPKIARIQLRFSDDQNVVVAHMLAGEAQMATDQSLGQTGGETLSHSWAATNGGTILQLPTTWRYLGFQLRPELATPKSLLDIRFRKAVAHALDRQPIVDAAYGGQAYIADTPVWSNSIWGPALEGVPTYPYDARLAEGLLNELGYVRGSDGVHRNAEGRLSLEIASTESPTTAAEILIAANQLQSAGFDMQQRVIPAAQAQDSQLRANFPGTQIISTLLGEPGLDTLSTTQTPTENNRWVGGNRGAWSSPEYDRLLTSFNHTLSRPERLTVLGQMLRIYTDELPRFSFVFPAQPTAFVSSLQGPILTPPESRVAWNVHLWELK
ncbi:MAG TPA: ABC transporter substrate-binding protein [Chloroflexota bacterium]